MKLFIKFENKKVYLRISARTRKELRRKIGRDKFKVKGHVFSINDVYAEAETDSTTTGAIIGGIIGAFAGPIGAITGGTIGGFVGNSSDNKDKNDVIAFNSSRL